MSQAGYGPDLWPVFPLRKLYTEQMFALLRSKRMQLPNMQAHKQWSVPSVKKAMRYIYRIKFRMCVSAREWNANRLVALRTLEGTLLVALWQRSWDLQVVFFSKHRGKYFKFRRDWKSSGELWLLVILGGLRHGYFVCKLFLRIFITNPFFQSTYNSQNHKTLPKASGGSVFLIDG